MPVSLLELSDGVIERMLRNKDYVVNYPFLATAAALYSQARVDAKGKACPPCQMAKRRRELGIDYNSLKKAFLALPAERRVALKQALGAKQIRVRWTGEKGKRVTQVF